MSLVQVVSKNLTVAGTTQTSNALSTTAKNALVFCAVYNATSAGVVTPSDSTGLAWTPVTSSPYAGGATGLTLGVWVARNITGNAANTFTFATTGADTPTFFVAEFSGRDLVAPFDLSVTASDAATVSGAHTTGTIFATGGDDLLAFNVSSALSQTYAAGGSWAIPPNGTVTTAAGYDAFVQYINSANNGANANTYSVTVTDKLDALVVALKPPPLPYSDEWLDAFQEVPEVYPVLNSFQQADVQPQITEVNQDWNDESGEDDAWVGVEGQSAPVVANNVASSAVQYYGEDAELYDEALELVQLAASYQSADSSPPLGAFNIDEPWDWFQEIDDDEWTYRDTEVLGASVVDAMSQNFDDAWDDEDPDEFFADDFGNDDADLPQNDVWDHWTTDDDDYPVTDDFLNLNNVGPTPIAVEDGWDQEHFGTDDADAQWTEDVYENDPNPLLNQEDPSWWDEEPDQYDGTATDLDAVGRDNNPVISAEDPWDWTQDEDDYVVTDDYALVDVVVVPLIAAEDPWDWFPGDPDDEAYHALDLDPVGPTLVVAIAQPPEDPWDWTQDDDDYSVSDDYVAVDMAVTAQVPVDDAWDWANTDDDDYFVDDLFALVDNAPIAPEDAWDHFATDPDDEAYHALDADQASVPQPQPPEDAWDHFATDPDDEAYYALDLDTVGPLAGLNGPTDGWDHFTTDEDDYATPDDYALVDAVVSASQLSDDPWDWFCEPAEDHEQDFGVGHAPLSASFYASDPSYVVYVPQRLFTAIWTPDA